MPATRWWGSTTACSSPRRSATSPPEREVGRVVALRLGDEQAVVLPHHLVAGIAHGGEEAGITARKERDAYLAGQVAALDRSQAVIHFTPAGVITVTPAGVKWITACDRSRAATCPAR
jgi:hypothetical protein